MKRLKPFSSTESCNTALQNILRTISHYQSSRVSVLHSFSSLTHWTLQHLLSKTLHTHVWVCDSQDAFREEKSATSSSVLALFNLSGDSLFSDKWSELVLVQRQQCALSITNHLTEKHSGSRERSGKNGGGLCEIDRSYLSALQFSESVSLTLFHLLLTPFHSLLPQSDLWDLKVYYYSDQISEMGLEN